jgi:hypothetical protein
VRVDGGCGCRGDVGLDLGVGVVVQQPCRLSVTIDANHDGTVLHLHRADILDQLDLLFLSADGR